MTNLARERVWRIIEGICVVVVAGLLMAGLAVNSRVIALEVGTDINKAHFTEMIIRQNAKLDKQDEKLTWIVRFLAEKSQNE